MYCLITALQIILNDSLESYIFNDIKKKNNRQCILLNAPVLAYFSVRNKGVDIQSMSEKEDRSNAMQEYSNIQTIW